MVVFLNGKFVNARDAKIPVFDPGFLYGDGIFETLRTYRGKIWQIEEHLERLFESARMRGWTLSWTRGELAAITEKTVKKNGYPESRVRITITAGIKAPTLFVWAQPLEKIPQSAYDRGVAVITFPLERSFPRMKTTSMQHLLVARNEMRRKRAFDALLVNHTGNITEGTWTNVFIVKKKTLVTPKLGVLLGMTRETVLKIARPLFRIQQRDITRRELMNADECFITNSPKGIVPVIKIDGEKVGTGRRGPITKHLQKEFNRRVWGEK